MDARAYWELGVFHCHMVQHMSPPDAPSPTETQPAAFTPTHEHSAGMAGLVMGITVLAGATLPPIQTAYGGAVGLS